MHRRNVTVSVVVAGLIACILGSSPAPATAEIRMQPLLTEDGSGRLFVNDPDGPWSWQSCKPNLTRCTHFASGGDISTDGAPPGTVFRVTGPDDVGTSPIWHGSLGIVRPPSARGRLRANELVIPVTATWSGGWDGDLDRTQLAICKTARGHGCISITDRKYVRGCQRDRAVIDPAFTGYYLRVADRRLGPGTITTAEAVASPYWRPIMKRDGQTAVAIVGRIRHATGPQTAMCEPAPLNSASISERGIASVKCILGCRVALHAVQGPARIRVIRRIDSRNAAGTRRRRSFRIPHRQLTQLESGTVQITVRTDGELVAQEDILLGS